MIRRDVTLADGRPGWLFIPQTEHARLSYVVASSWRDLLPEAPDGVRDEFLAAVLRHDDGWTDWWDAPGVDPESGTPYAFTEMPPTDAQRLWLESIDACRAIGPLAGWVVASHFIALQSKRDGDYPEWVEWLDSQQSRADGWLAAWRAVSNRHTQRLAEACLHELRAFDWISLWLCCRGGLDDEPLEMTQNEGIVRFETGENHRFPFDPLVVRVGPWPFTVESLEVAVTGRVAPAEPLSAPLRFESIGESISVRWRLLRPSTE